MWVLFSRLGQLTQNRQGFFQGKCLFLKHYLFNFSCEGKKFENTEMFGQYPLQVNGFKDLHECLEAAMIEGEIESLHSENSAKSGQEVS